MDRSMSRTVSSGQSWWTSGLPVVSASAIGPLNAGIIEPSGCYRHRVRRAPRLISSGSLRLELFGQPDYNFLGAPDVAEPIFVFVLDHFADEPRAASAEPGERVVDVLHGEH